LELAYEAAKKGGSIPSVLNSSNEMAVRAFLGGRIRFTDITLIIERLLKQHKRIEFPSLEEIERIEKWVKEEVERFCLSR
jgi:1-deoxy-D-xylulose-5-phosphate reductoisomerase